MYREKGREEREGRERGQGVVLYLERACRKFCGDKQHGNVSHIRRETVREGDSMTVQSLRQKTGHAAWHTFRPSFSAKSWRKLCPRSCNINAVIYNLHANSQCSKGGFSFLLLPAMSNSCMHIYCAITFCGMSHSALPCLLPLPAKKKIFRRQRLIARAWLGLVPSKYI